MRLTEGKLTAADLGDDATFITVKVPGRIAVTMGEDIRVFSLPGFDETRLRELYAYLIDRPALMDDKEVKEGVSELKAILGIY